jgi:hypothetical protein
MNGRIHEAGRMPIDNNTVIGTEEWPLLGYNIFMRQKQLGLPSAGSATIGCFVFGRSLYCLLLHLTERYAKGVSARVRRYAGSMSLKVNNHALFGVSLFFGFDGLHSLHHVPGNNFEICHP